MPNYYLFYQTMDPCFDGSDVERNSTFEKVMQIISGKFINDDVLAASFTELQLLNQSAVHGALTRMASILDAGLHTPILFATEVNGMPGGIAICVNKKFTVEKRGRAMRVMQEKGDPVWKCVPEDEVHIEVLKRSSTGAKSAEVSDNLFETGSRGLAYVCGKLRDQKVVLGFTHRISAEGREKTYNLLTDIMRLIWEKHPAYNKCPTFFGGDFSFAPSPMAEPYYAVYAATPTGASTKDDLSTWEPFPTSDKHGFDFWVTNSDTSNDRASLHAEPYNFKVSRHFGISLRVRAKVYFEEEKK